MALRRATSLLRPVTGIVRQEFCVAQRCMSDRSTFDDKEHAMEDLYIKVSSPAGLHHSSLFT
jgi:hypothetical protein